MQIGTKQKRKLGIVFFFIFYKTSFSLWLFQLLAMLAVFLSTSYRTMINMIIDYYKIYIHTHIFTL